MIGYIQRENTCGTYFFFPLLIFCSVVSFWEDFRQRGGVMLGLFACVLIITIYAVDVSSLTLGLRVCVRARSISRRHPPNGVCVMIWLAANQ